MKKKLVATLLCASMVAASLAGCGSEETVTETTEAAVESTEAAEAEATTEAATEEAAAAPVVEVAAAEELPAEFAHITFDEGAGESYVAVTQTDNVGDNDGATYGIEPTDATFAYSDGAVGQALFLDGSYGLDLGLEATNTDAYTISFWTYASRLSTYGPTLQVGYDIGKASDAGNDVTWLNVTQAEWGDQSAKIFPIVWSRNEASDGADGTDCWPWMYAFDNSIHGKKEWVHVTIVASGETTTAPAGASALMGAQYYINGAKVYDSLDNFNNGTYFEMTWDASLAPNVMQPGDKEFESYFGINYWDTIFKGFVDDLYVFDTALTAGQVATLYQMGDASVVPVEPEGTETVEEEAEAVAFDNSGAITTGTVVGALDCTSAFWTEFSDIWEVPEGESVTKTFVNYTDGLANWDNFLCVLQTTPEGHSADTANGGVEGYAEYAVVRADNWGWGTGYDNIATAECDWDFETAGQFSKDINGATVELTVTNNGDTADIVAVVTSADGTVHNQSYTGIAIDGDLYFCLTLEKAFLDIQD